MRIPPKIAAAARQLPSEQNPQIAGQPAPKRQPPAGATATSSFQVSFPRSMTPVRDLRS
jgi:hypothetical protein